MKLLSRYLITRLTVMSGYALLALLALYSFIDLLAENIGEGSYTFMRAVQYTAMQMPARAYLLMPLATLIGGLIALSQLASNSELAVMKTSGWRTSRFIANIMQFSLIFAIITALLGEWIAPQLSRYADNMKTIAKTGQASSTQRGVWIKQPNSMVYIDAMLPDKTLLDISIWQYNDQWQLTEAVHAEKATMTQQTWQLHNVQSSRFADNRVDVQKQPARLWQLNISNQLMDVLRVKPEQMSFSALTDYIRYLKQNKQQTLAYDVAWWNKLVYPIATMVMALVALAFTPISGRNTNLGLKLFGGVCLGLLFFFTGRLFGFSTQLYGVPAFLSAVMPTALFACLAIYLIYRQEKR